MGYDEGHIEFSVIYGGETREGLLVRKADGQWELLDADDECERLATFSAGLSEEVLDATARGFLSGHVAGYRSGVRDGEHEARKAIRNALGL